jgi:hypothetical protein
MRTLVVLLLLAAIAVPAGAGSRLRKPKRGFQMRVGEFSVQPGQDLEVCEYRRLPNRKPVDVQGFDLRMPEGAHHFVVWAYGGDTQDDTHFPQGPVESIGCTGVSPDELAPQVLIPIQNPNSSFRFPPGIALRIEPHQQVWLNPHLKNFGAESITPDIRFNFRLAKKGSVKHYAHGLIAGNMAGINVPAGGDQTMTAEWTAPVGLSLIAFSTHQHRLGTYANIEHVPPGGTRAVVYETTDWQHARRRGRIHRFTSRRVIACGSRAPGTTPTRRRFASVPRRPTRCASSWPSSSVTTRPSPCRARSACRRRAGCSVPSPPS